MATPNPLQALAVPSEPATGEVIDDPSKPYIVDRYGNKHLRPTVKGTRTGYVAAAPASPGVALPPPVQDFLGKAGNVLEAPLTLIGAAQMDLQRERNLEAAGGAPASENPLDTLVRTFGNIQPAHRYGESTEAPHNVPNTSLGHAIEMLRNNQYGAAANLYSTTSLEANRTRAALGDPGAQFGNQHPTVFSGAAAGEEFANPSQLALGAAAGLGGDALRTPGLNRFADVRAAAEEAPAQRAAAAAADAERKAHAATVRGDAAKAKAQARRAAAWRAKQVRAGQIQDARDWAQYLREQQNLAMPVNAQQQALLPGQELLEPPISQPGVAPRRLPPANQVVVPPVRPALPRPGPEGPPNPPFATAARPALTGEAQAALPPGAQTPAEAAAAARAAARAQLRSSIRGRRVFRKPLAMKPGQIGVPGEVPQTQPALAAGVPPRGGPFTALPAQPNVESPEFQPSLGSEARPEIPAGERGKPPTGTAGTITTPREPGTAIEPAGEAQAAQPLPAEEAPPRDVADRAEREFHKMAETQTARAASAEMTHELYKGLTKAQETQMIHVLEGTEPMPPQWAKRIARYRQRQRWISDQLLETEIADVGQLWNDPTFHPRAGASLNPNFDLEEQQLQGEHIASARGIRKGTLNRRRTYATLKDMQEAGELMNEESWAPKALEDTVYSRLQSIQLERGMRELKRLGLITNPGDPIPPGWVTLVQEPDVARFGSPTINGGAAFHPAIAKGIRDITYSTMNPDKLLSSPLHRIMTPLAMANRFTSRFEVSNPIYHPIINVGPNQIATILAHSQAHKALPEYFKQLAQGGHPNEAYAAGAAFPYASDIPAHKMTRPWSDLSAKEKAERAWNLSGRTVENLTAKPLYKHIEPRMAGATYKALQKGGVSEPKAALLTRQTVGESENLGAVERDAAQMMQFPAWRKAVFRLWPKLLASSPALYMAPHRGVQAYNLSRGLGVNPNDSDTLIPGIAFGKDAQGNPQTLNLPSPANLPLQLIDIIGAPLAGDYGELPSRLARLGLTAVNPLLNTGVRSFGTLVAKSGEANSGIGGYRILDKDAPQNQTPQGVLASLALGTESRYAPVRSQGFTRSNLPQDEQMYVNVIESRYRKLMGQLRMAAVDAHKAGDDATAQEYTQDANDLYDEMEQMVQGITTPAAAPAKASSSSDNPLQALVQQ